MSDSSALDRIQQQILTQPNPFEDRAVGDPWDRAPITDVSSINSAASDTVFRLLEGVNRDRQTRIILLLGETGAGKSHLIHRILRQLDERGLFVHVEPFGEASLVCKHILREIAVSLGRRRRPGAAPQIVDFAACVIRDTWRHLLIERGVGRTPKGREQIDKLSGSLEYVFNSFRRQDRFRPIYEALLTHLCDDAPDLDRQFLKTFFRVLLDEDRATVLDWLKGKDLEDIDLKRIGAPRGLLSEDEAFNTIRALAILSRFYKPLVICFDQNESLLWGDDDSRFQALVTTLCRVHDFTPNCLLLFTCLKQVWVHDYTRRLQKPEIARFESRPVHLDGLTTESAAALVAARMQRVFGELQPPYPTYPFRPEFFEEFAVLGLPMARELINLCLDRIEDLRTFGRVLEITSPIQTTSTSSRLGDSGPWPWQEHLGKLWDSTIADLERLRQQRVEEENEIVLEGDFPLDFDEGTLRWTLGRCFLRFQEHDDRIGGCRITHVEEGLAEDHKVDFVLTVEHKHGTDRVALVVNNTRNGNRFSSHLQSVVDYLESGGAQRFFLIRNEPESDGWRRGKNLLDQVLAFGGKRVSLDARSLVEVLTFYRLCNQAQAGDLVADGKAIPRELVEQFVIETGQLSSVPIFEKIFREVVRLARQDAYDREMESFHDEEEAVTIEAASDSTRSPSDAAAVAEPRTEEVAEEAPPKALESDDTPIETSPPASKDEVSEAPIDSEVVLESEASPSVTVASVDVVAALTLPEPLTKPSETSSSEEGHATEASTKQDGPESPAVVEAEASPGPDLDEPVPEDPEPREAVSPSNAASADARAVDSEGDEVISTPAELDAGESTLEADAGGSEAKLSLPPSSGLPSPGTSSSTGPESPSLTEQSGSAAPGLQPAVSGAMISMSEVQRFETLVRLPQENAAHKIAVVEVAPAKADDEAEDLPSRTSSLPSSVVDGTQSLATDTEEWPEDEVDLESDALEEFEIIEPGDRPGS